MEKEKHKVFISYHHTNDQAYKDRLQLLNSMYDLFIDVSVDIGDIDDRLDDQAIRQKIRDDYLRNSSVTILLVGADTKNRKHIDWELFSSMIDGKVNKKSGILVINLPTVSCTYYTAAHGDLEKDVVYPNIDNWTSITTRSEYERLYPYMPARVIDNLLESDVRISVADWSYITSDVKRLELLIEATFADRESCKYNLARPMRRSNS